MSADDALYVAHMAEMARKAVGKIDGLVREDYDDDENLRLALTRLVQVIGEAARQVSAQTREENPDVPWREIIGMRNRIVHDYLNVDEDVVWQVVSEDLPPLLPLLQKIVPPHK